MSTTQKALFRRVRLRLLGPAPDTNGCEIYRGMGAAPP